MTPTQSRPVWQRLAACRGMDPDLFFPLGERGEWAGEIEVAREVCGSCPVQTECLAYALADPLLSGPDDSGIWGGLTAGERHRLRREAS